MTSHPLTLEEQGNFNATHRVAVTFADLAALTGGTGAQTLATLVVAANMGMSLVFAYIKTPFTFSDGTLISCAFQGGDSGSAARFLASMEAANAASPATVKGGVALNPNVNVYSAADSFLLTITPTSSKNLNTATAGEIHFYLTVRNAPVP